MPPPRRWLQQVIPTPKTPKDPARQRPRGWRPLLYTPRARLGAIPGSTVFGAKIFFRQIRGSDLPCKTYPVVVLGETLQGNSPRSTYPIDSLSGMHYRASCLGRVALY